jgi:hypothetical protein
VVLVFLELRCSVSGIDRFAFGFWLAASVMALLLILGVVKEIRGLLVRIEFQTEMIAQLTNAAQQEAK